MRLVKAKDIYNEAMSWLGGKTPDGQPHPKDVAKADVLVNELLNSNPGNPLVLYLAGTICMERNQWGLGVQILSQVTHMKPDHGEAWNNLGIAWQHLREMDRAAVCFRQAAKLIPHADIPSNMAAVHLNRNMPEKALAFANVALEMNPDHVQAKWHKALALLEMSRWDEAWEWHEARIDGGAGEKIGVRNYHGGADGGMTPWWDGKSPGLVAVHGEEGLGDEIMFASCIPDAARVPGVRLILEPCPRLGGLFARSFDNETIATYGTHDLTGKDWVPKIGRPDFKIALGSLPKFFRRRLEDFPGTPYLKADPEKVAYWREQLAALGPGLKVGIGWQGGVHSTRQDLRSLHPSEFAPMFGLPVHFVSLQYDETAPLNVLDVKRDFGIDIHHWPQAVAARDPATGKENDLDNLAALTAGLDLVITVPQTAYHLAGALGVETWCLTQSEPDWRLGAGDAMTVPWYNSLILIRQERGTRDWKPVVAQAAARLGQRAARASGGPKAVGATP
jgi:tetratricopeptide (TPR) repeat protein